MVEQTSEQAAPEQASTKPQVVIATRIKDILHESEINASGDFLDAMNDYVVAACKKVVERCKGNGRKTAKPVDL